MDPVDNTTNDALIERKISDILAVREAAREFYEESANKVGKIGAMGCAMGALGGALLGSAAGPWGATVGAVKGCSWFGGVSGLLAAINCPMEHWTANMKAAYRARKAYKKSLEWLSIDGFDLAGLNAEAAAGRAKREFRNCALKYHPDKIPSGATDAHRGKAAMKLANCKFAKFYVLAFQSKYGVLDPDDLAEETHSFLKKFAGVWASSFGQRDTMTEGQVQEWMEAIKHHQEL